MNVYQVGSGALALVFFVLVSIFWGLMSQSGTPVDFWVIFAFSTSVTVLFVGAALVCSVLLWVVWSIAKKVMGK